MEQPTKPQMRIYIPLMRIKMLVLICKWQLIPEQWLCLVNDWWLLPGRTRMLLIQLWLIHSLVAIVNGPSFHKVTIYFTVLVLVFQHVISHAFLNSWWHLMYQTILERITVRVLVVDHTNSI